MFAAHPLLRLCASLSLVVLAGCGGDASSGQDEAPGQQAAASEAPPPASAPASAPGDTGQVQERQQFDLTALGFDDGVMDEAVVHVIEFSDFGCVHCANFHIDSYPTLYEEFVQAGDVAWKYVPITLAGFPNSREAALAGECAGEQDRFPAMRDRLFHLRESWMQADDPEPLFVNEAREIGLDTETFRTCLAESASARDRIAEGSRIAQAVGITGTPTFVIQGQPVQGAPPLDAFREVLRELVAEARGPGS